MKKLTLIFLSLLAGWSTSAQTPKAEEYFKPLKYRSIGPFRGGRSVTSTGVKGDPLTYYMGTTGGGLWKTIDGSQHWTNISDGYFETGSVGAVAVSESSPNVVYCGMGEHAPRGVMTSYGDGIYKSIDAGKTWTKLRLEATQHISRIAIHPKNPDIVYIAAQGALYAPNKERGIYKSTDGGKSWKKVLYINESTGRSELSIDFNFPDILYATMWQHQRKPWEVVSGGEGSGLYKSTDGGETWFKIEEGLPKEKGKMAIAVSRANSNKVYALIESDSKKDLGGLFVSENGGKTWSRISDDNRLTQRAWYYTEVFPDPQDEHTVYVMSAPALRSIDDGKTWERLSGTHGDFHDLWINPDNSKNMVIANDGGAAVSFDNGASWSSQATLPTAQIYRINTDNLFPYNIYSGQQDNSSLRISSLSLGAWGIDEHDWTSSAGGESAFLAFNPDNPRYVMGGSYLGTIEVMDMKSKASINVMAAPIQYLGRAARDMKYLYNWNAPIIWSQHEPGTFYHCAQVVLRTRDMGITWEEVSPDLTRNQDHKQGNGGGPYTNEAVGAENYGTISYIIESPIEKGVFYTGSDDGYVYITKNGGESWQNVTPKDLQECLVNAVEVSPHDPATAYIATTRYKFNDYTPAIYKTNNYGKTWKNISTGIPYGAFTRVVREDAGKKDLLYAGTEKGIYVSFNGGATWEPFQLNLPITPITDLKVHQGNLIVATSGRGLWILDDLSVLDQYKVGKKAKLYEPSDAIYGYWGSPLSGDSESFTGASAGVGVNPANGMVIYYELPKLADSTKLTLEVWNEEGKLIRSFSSEADKNYKRYAGGPPSDSTLPKKEGLNRIVWDLRNPIMPGVPNVYIEASYRGHTAPPGKYNLKLKWVSNELTSKASILKNPLYETQAGQYKTYDSLMTNMEANLTEMHKTVNTLYNVQQQLKNLSKDLKDESLKASADSLTQTLDSWDKDMVQRLSKAYDDVENFPNKFTAEYMYLINKTESSIPRINHSSLHRKKELDAQWAELKVKANLWLTETIPAFNKKLWEAGVGAIRVK